jgi:hypothetical protein
LAEIGAYLAVVALALLIARTLGGQSLVPIMALCGGIALVAAMAYSARYEVTLTLLAAYLMLADGYLKLRYPGQLSLLGRDALLLAVTFGAGARWALARHEIRLPPLAGWVVAWVLVVLVQLGNPANGTIAHSIQALRPHIEFVPLFFLGYAYMRTQAHLRGIVWLLVVLAAINGVVGFIQINLSPDELASWGVGYAERINGTHQGISGRAFVDAGGNLRTRPFALGSDQGFGGALGVLAAPAALALFAVTRSRRLLAIAVPLAFGTALAVVTSQARVAVLGGLAGIAIYALLGAVARRRAATVIAIALGGLVTWLVISAIAGGTYAGVFDRYKTIAPNRVVSTAVSYREQTIRTIPDYAISFPLGAGIGTVGPGGSTGGGTGRVLNGESEFTFLLIEAGIAGFIVMVGFNLRLMQLVATRVRRVGDADTRLLLAALGAPFFAKFLSWFGGPSTAGTPDSPYMWFIGGVLAWWLIGAFRPERAQQPDPTHGAAAL